MKTFGDGRTGPGIIKLTAQDLQEADSIEFVQLNLITGSEEYDEFKDIRNNFNSLALDTKDRKGRFSTNFEQRVIHGHTFEININDDLKSISDKHSITNDSKFSHLTISATSDLGDSSSSSNNISLQRNSDEKIEILSYRNGEQNIVSMKTQPGSYEMCFHHALNDNYIIVQGERNSRDTFHSLTEPEEGLNSKSTALNDTDGSESQTEAKRGIFSRIFQSIRNTKPRKKNRQSFNRLRTSLRFVRPSRITQITDSRLHDDTDPDAELKVDSASINNRGLSQRSVLPPHSTRNSDIYEIAISPSHGLSSPTSQVTSLLHSFISKEPVRIRRDTRSERLSIVRLMELGIFKRIRRTGSEQESVTSSRLQPNNITQLSVQSSTSGLAESGNVTSRFQSSRSSGERNDSISYSFQARHLDLPVVPQQDIRGVISPALIEEMRRDEEDKLTQSFIADDEQLPTNSRENKIKAMLGNFEDSFPDRLPAK
ncbi:hypothetical protein WICMUC_001264 [Wickerhamomyces mucosus]|uniref:Uncharacterized protein n=1 Tax=Wickerhamomyces mucosus TaxID=1378264 RepID=A0A9P8THJ9_9ASCO|nr:hypothetical protein WICMUC_001264 [Wickerhamomyces mucosus]